MSTSFLMAGRPWRLALLAILFAIAPAGSARAAILIQDAADDAGALGTSGRWEALGVTSSRSSIANDSHALTVSLAAGDRASLSRTADLGSTPTAILCTFDLSFSGVGAARPVTQMFRLGWSFGSSNSDESDVHTYARLGITATAAGFRLRDAGGATTAVFHGTQAITWALNNTGQAMSYAAPNGTAESIANDRMDVWVGRDKVLDDVAVTSPDGRVTDLKWFWGQGSGVVRFDHFGLRTLDRFDGIATAAAPAPMATIVPPPADESGNIALDRPAPNPFKQTMRFAYAIPTGSSSVDVAVFDIAGRQVRQLAHGTQTAGQYEVRWNGLGNDGARVTRGVYFLRASVGANQRITRIVYLPE